MDHATLSEVIAFIRPGSRYAVHLRQDSKEEQFTEEVEVQYIDHGTGAARVAKANVEKTRTVPVGEPYAKLEWRDTRTTAPTPQEINDGAKALAEWKLLQHVNAKRKEAAGAGIVYSGQRVGTDIETRASLSLLRDAMKKDEKRTVILEGVPYELTAAALGKILTAIDQHVQGCFDAQAQMIAEVKNGNLTSTAQIDAAWSVTI